MEKKPKHFGWYEVREGGIINVAMREKPLSDEEYDEFEEIVGVAAEIRPYIIDYLTLERDYIELRQLKDELLAEAHEHERPLRETAVHVTFAFVKAQQKIFNFLSSAHALRDRLRRRLASKHGKNADEVKKFDDSTHAVYDASFAYRLMYNLRNYAQHNESPVSIVPLSGNRPSDTQDMVYSVRVLLRLSELLNSTDVQKSFRPELEARGDEQVDIVDLADEYMGCLQIIVRQHIETYRDRLARFEGYARVILTSGEVPKGATPVIWNGAPPDGDAQNFRMDVSADYFSFDELALLNRIYRQIQAPQLVAIDEEELIAQEPKPEEQP